MTAVSSVGERLIACSARWGWGWGRRWGWGRCREARWRGSPCSLCPLMCRV